MNSAAQFLTQHSCLDLKVLGTSHRIYLYLSLRLRLKPTAQGLKAQAQVAPVSPELQDLAMADESDTSPKRIRVDRSPDEELELLLARQSTAASAAPEWARQMQVHLGGKIDQIHGVV